MKKIMFAFSLIGAFMATGCLKDKAFDDQEFGIRDTEVKGIGFPRTNFTAGIVGVPATQAIAKVVVGLNSVTAPTSNVTYTISSTPAALPAGITPVPATNIILAAGGTFEAGTISDTIALSVRNADQLDPNLNYGIAITINSVSDGYIISQNTKTIVVNVNIKNRWDGVYEVVSGYIQRYSAPGVPTVNDDLNGDLTGNDNIELSTISATKVQFSGFQWHGGGGVGGIDNTQATIDPVTNLVTMSSLGNATLANWAGKENKYDPLTKTFTLNFRWNPASTTREMTLVLRYVGPRP